MSPPPMDALIGRRLNISMYSPQNFFSSAWIMGIKTSSNTRNPIMGKLQDGCGGSGSLVLDHYPRVVYVSIIKCDSTAKNNPAKNGERKVACPSHTFEQMVQVRKNASKPKAQANIKCIERHLMAKSTSFPYSMCLLPHSDLLILPNMRMFQGHRVDQGHDAGHLPRSTIDAATPPSPQRQPYTRAR